MYPLRDAHSTAATELFEQLLVLQVCQTQPVSLGQRNDRRTVGIVIRLEQLGRSEQHRCAQRREGCCRHQHLAPTDPVRWTLIDAIDGTYRPALAGAWKLRCHVLVLIAHVLIMVIVPLWSL